MILIWIYRYENLVNERQVCAPGDRERPIGSVKQSEPQEESDFTSKNTEWLKNFKKCKQSLEVKHNFILSVTIDWI